MLGALVDFGRVECSATDAWRRQALTLTKDYCVTFYDAAYHALALVEGGVFISTDRRYAENARDAGGVVLRQAWR